MTSRDQVAVGRNIINVVSVLALVLLLSLSGLIALGVVDGDAGVRSTLTHVSETVLGVFIGLAAGRLTSNGSAGPTGSPGSMRSVGPGSSIGSVGSVGSEEPSSPGH